MTSLEKLQSNQFNSSGQKNSNQSGSASLSFSNLTPYVSKGGNKISLSGTDLSTKEGSELITQLTEKYPNTTELDISNCNLQEFPTILLSFKRLASFDLRNNQFSDFEKVVQILTGFNSLTDLKIDLTDQNQVLMILSQIPKLILLNGKSTKDAVTIVDVDEKDIEEISLQNELPVFNEVVNKLNEKENLGDPKFAETFQAKLYEEAEKIKNCLNNNAPNYIYANVVIESQFNLQKYLCEKFLGTLDKNDKQIGTILFKNIFQSGERLVELINNLYPKIEEKTDTLRNQLEDAWKAAEEITDFEQKFNETKKEKDILLNDNSLMKQKMLRLENENKFMTQKLLKNAKELFNQNKNTFLNNDLEKQDLMSPIKEGSSEIPSEIFSNMKNKENNLEALNTNQSRTQKNNEKNAQEKYQTGNFGGTNSNNPPMNNNENIVPNNSIPNLTNVSSQGGFSPSTKILSIKMTKDIMNEIYNSKSNFDKKCYENKLPRETMEQHMYTYLNQKYGLKNLIIEWASSIINAIKLYSNEDSDINLFGKILRNEQEEDSRFMLMSLRQNISDLLEYYLKSKNPLKIQADIKKMLDGKKEGMLTEEEWKGIICYIYNQEDSQIIENKISNFIHKQNAKINLPYAVYNQTNSDINNDKMNTTSSNNISHTNPNYTGYLTTQGHSNNKKLTREEIFNLTRLKEDMSISYKEFIKLVSDHQIKSREKYLRNFVKLFRKFDSDSDGILNEPEFISLVKAIPYCQNNIDEYIFKFLSIIDPFNNKKITFNECVSLFSLEMCDEGQDNIQSSMQSPNTSNPNVGLNNQTQTTLLDKICLC